MERDEAQAGEGDQGREGFSRRGVLTGAVLGATALLLASCQGGEDEEDEGDDD
jgi:hypothetical protein